MRLDYPQFRRHPYLFKIEFFKIDVYRDFRSNALEIKTPNRRIHQRELRIDVAGSIKGMRVAWVLEEALQESYLALSELSKLIIYKNYV